jgi:4-amino-4-deoxychorismate lyase
MSPPAPALIETLRVRHGAVPLRAIHARRLAAGCAALGLPCPAIDIPAGGPDRAVRLEVGSGRAVVTTREVGPTTPVRLVTSAVVHQPYCHKTTLRAQFDRVLAQARNNNADDGLMLTAGGLVAETAIWCVYWWEGGKIVAPDLDLGVLPGVSRARIEELAGPVRPARVLREDLASRSLFLSNAVRGVVPVGWLDGVALPRDAGTAALAERFWP